MSRILYWNINNFSLPKIFVAAPLAAANFAASRRHYIVNQVMAGPVGGPPPDIIVVVEVYSRVRDVGAEGTVLRDNSNAGQGVLQLLADIRASPALNPAPAIANWCVVPPLNLGEFGQREAVAVFYNATNLRFTGPNLFYQLYGPPGAIVGQSQPVNAATFAAMTPYPIAWQQPALAALARTTVFPVVGAIAESQLAGEWQYYVNPPARPIPSPRPPEVRRNRIKFPNQGCRGPFYTRFLDIAGGRTINLFSIHTSPRTARRAVDQLIRIQKIDNAPPAGELNVVLGDFNVDSFSGIGGTLPGPYMWLAPPFGHYTMALDPRTPPVVAPPPAQFVVQARKPYCMTHFLPTSRATPYNSVGIAADPQHNVYPRFGYMGSMETGPDGIPFGTPGNSGAIDNIFTRYGGGAAVAPAVNNITVINTLTGTPYTAIPPALGGVTPELLGGLPYASTLDPLVPNMLIAVPPANFFTRGIDPPNLAAEIAFRGWDNFCRVYSTSDHLPLMIDV